ncbi:MAG: hypothetical protein ACXVLO_07705 [Acidimicrobiia bacterium]
MIRSRARDERGVSLVLVLVTLVVFGLLVPVLGQFGSTNGVSGYLLKGQRFDRYAAESGMQEAIAWAQNQRTAGRNKVPCTQIETGTLPGGSSAFDRSVTVKCQGLHDSGATQATPTIPEFALMAVGNGGIQVSGGSGKTAGAWWSNGDVTADSIDATTDYVGAVGSCHGLVAAPADCDQGSAKLPPTDLNVALPGVVSPDLVQDGCHGSVVRVPPGLHWQRAGFWDDIADGDNGCDGVVVWLEPGVHVFDFSLFDPASPTTFRFRRGHAIVVGGTPRGWDPFGGGNQFAAASAALDSDAGACDPSGHGASVVFAGATTLTMRESGGTRARFDICGEGTGQRVALAQVVNGSNPVDAPPVAATPTTATPSDRGGFFDWPRTLPGPPNPLATVDCDPNRGACDDAHVVSGRLTGDRAQGTVVMNVADPIPAGSILRSIQLRITHQESNTGDVNHVRAWVAGLASGAGDLPLTCDLTQLGHEIPESDRWRTDTVTCDVSGFDAPYFPTGRPVQVAYQVELRSGRDGDRDRSSTVALDNVTLAATYARPTFRSSTPGATDLVDVGGGATLRLDGTANLPTGDVTVDFSGRSTFRRGAVVKTMSATGIPDDPNFAPFSLPNGGSYKDRLVTFAAFLDNDPSKPILTSRVQFCDPQPDLGAVADPCTADAGQDPQILSWDPRR